jgi:hypothetical protein
MTKFTGNARPAIVVVVVVVVVVSLECTTLTSLPSFSYWNHNYT